MSGKQSQKLHLSSNQQKLLEAYLSKNTIQHHYQKRISIILWSFSGQGIREISRKLSIATKTVTKWRNRWLASFEKLCACEQDKKTTDKTLLDKMLSILSDAPRSGAPVQISLSEKESIVALSCEKPKDFGIPFSRWNREILTEVAISNGLVKKISAGYVSCKSRKAGQDFKKIRTCILTRVVIGCFLR